MAPANFQQLANFIWSVADLLRGPYRPPQYERVMLPLTVLRRFDAVLAPTKETVLRRYETLKGKDPQLIDRVLNELAKDEDGKPLGFHNHSPLDFRKLKGDPDHIGRHLADYLNGFSENIRKIFERFEFEKEIEKLEEANRLYQVVSQFAEIDLHPRRVDNITMGLVFEDLIRRFNEAANETAGDHFTPREVIQLMINLLLEPDTDVLTQEGIIVKICDPACGTGGMLAESQNWIRAHNEHATVIIDEITREHGALTESKTSKVFDNADFGYRRVTLLRPLRLKFQITQEAKERYLDTCLELLDAVLAVEDALGNEPHFDWSKVWDEVQRIVKRLPDDQGWAKGTKGTAQKKAFRDAFTEVDPEAAPVIAKAHREAALDVGTLFPGQTLPELAPDEIKVLLGLNPAGKGKFVEYEADSNLKDFENIPLKEDILSYVLREVRPYVADAWIDRETLDEQDGGIGKVGYEINFNREFFEYKPPRPLAEIDAELAAVEKRIMGLLREVVTE